MSRRAKSKPPARAAIAPLVTDRAELDQRTEMVRQLWRAAGLAAQCPTTEQFEDLAWHISSCAAVQPNAEAEKLATGARAAIATLLAWCRHDPHEKDLPHLVFRDARLIALEDALIPAQDLARSAPGRVWVYPAWSTWKRVATIMAGVGGKAGYGPAAPAVRFTSKMLQWVGHPSATPDAISSELRKHPEFRTQDRE